MKNNILLMIFLFLTISGFSQINNPIDLSKWYKMDSSLCDLNSDGHLDVFRIYNNSTDHSFTDYGYPVLIYCSNNSKLSFLIRFDKVIVIPYYKIEDCLNGEFTIVQDGQKQDRNKYIMYFRHDKNNNKIFLVKKAVYELKQKVKIDSITKKMVYYNTNLKLKSEKIYEQQLSIEKVDFFNIFKDEYPKE